MPHYVPEIELLKIDLDSLDDIDDDAETIVFDVLLNGPPTSRWIEEFGILYDKTPFAIKPPIAVVDDRLRINYLPRYQKELQSYINFLSQAVHMATAEARRTESIKISDLKEERKKEFRTILSGVRLR